jgi:hypothetical protein
VCSMGTGEKNNPEFGSMSLRATESSGRLIASKYTRYLANISETDSCVDMNRFSRGQKVQLDLAAEGKIFV